MFKIVPSGLDLNEISDFAPNVLSPAELNGTLHDLRTCKSRLSSEEWRGIKKLFRELNPTTAVPFHWRSRGLTMRERMSKELGDSDEVCLPPPSSLSVSGQPKD